MTSMLSTNNFLNTFFFLARSYLSSVSEWVSDLLHLVIWILMCSSANREIGIAYSAQPQNASRKIRPQGVTEAKCGNLAHKRHRQPRDPRVSWRWRWWIYHYWQTERTSGLTHCAIRDSETLTQLWSWGKPEENWFTANPSEWRFKIRNSNTVEK